MNKFDVMVIGLSIAFAFMFVRLVILRYQFKIWNKILLLEYIKYIVIIKKKQSEYYKFEFF